jgi:hypothetical protein
MMGSKERTFAPLCNRSIEDLVPADNFYPHLDAKLDLSFVRDRVADKYAERGRPAVDPVVFFRAVSRRHRPDSRIVGNDPRTGREASCTPSSWQERTIDRQVKIGTLQTL